jgi:hypothetical protein
MNKEEYFGLGAAKFKMDILKYLKVVTVIPTIQIIETLIHYPMSDCAGPKQG